MEQRRTFISGGEVTKPAYVVPPLDPALKAVPATGHVLSSEVGFINNDGQFIIDPQYGDTLRTWVHGHPEGLLAKGYIPQTDGETPGGKQVYKDEVYVVGGNALVNSQERNRRRLGNYETPREGVVIDFLSRRKASVPVISGDIAAGGGMG